MGTARRKTNTASTRYPPKSGSPSMCVWPPFEEKDYHNHRQKTNCNHNEYIIHVVGTKIFTATGLDDTVRRERGYEPRLDWTRINALAKAVVCLQYTSVKCLGVCIAAREGIMELKQRAETITVQVVMFGRLLRILHVWQQLTIL